MKRLLVSVIVVGLIFALVACGSKNTTPSSGITISPTTSSIKTGETVQFTFASVGSTNTNTVNWQVNGNIGGNTTDGTITGTGLYIAPATVPSKNPVTVTAVSATDSTISASAAVTITAGDPVAVTLLPGTASVGTSQTTQFTATVSNTANTAVTWKVGSVVGGDAINGTIDTTGLYTAPANVPTPATVTIMAISQADTTKAATAKVTVTPFKFVTVTPSAVPILLAGAHKDFVATVDGANANVTWTVHCPAQIASDCGSIVSKNASTGTYTAPLSPPPGGDVTITATTTDNSANPGGAVATIAFGNASLTGHYAFSLASPTATTVGSISFDGTGNISGGIEDVGGGSAKDITGGTYNIGSDGRGSLTVDTSSGSVGWQIALVNHSEGFVVNAGSSNTAGTIKLQNSADFNSAAVNGRYAFSLAGMNAGGAAASLAAAGSLAANGSGSVTGGLLDINSAGAASTNLGVTGTYTAPSSDGRGTLTISSSFGDQHFAYYLVDATHLMLIETDASHVATGDLVKQAAGPFTKASFNGGYAFTFSGSGNQRPLAEGGLFGLDGAGNFTNATIDINSNGNVQSDLAFTGTYNVTDGTTGRSTVTVAVNGANRDYVFYPQGDGALAFVGLGSADITSGRAFVQTGSSFSHSSVQGNYALLLSGTDLIASGPEGIVGQLLPNGGAAITGLLDANDAGTVARSAVLQGAYSVTTANGRGTATLQTGSGAFPSGSFNLYVVDTGRVLFMESDSNRVLVGVIKKQF